MLSAVGNINFITSFCVGCGKGLNFYFDISRNLSMVLPAFFVP